MDEIQIEHAGAHYDHTRRIYWIEARLTNPLDQQTIVIAGASRNHISDEMHVDVCTDAQAEVWLESIVKGYREIPDIFHSPRHLEARANDRNSQRELLGFLTAIPE